MSIVRLTPVFARIARQTPCLCPWYNKPSSPTGLSLWCSSLVLHGLVVGRSSTSGTWRQRVKLHYTQHPQGRRPQEFASSFAWMPPSFGRLVPRVGTCTSTCNIIHSAPGGLVCGQRGLIDPVMPTPPSSQVGATIDAQAQELQCNGILTPPVTVEVECF